MSALPALCSVPSIPSSHCLVGTGLNMLSLLEAERGSPHFPSPVSGNRQASNTAFQFPVWGQLGELGTCPRSGGDEGPQKPQVTLSVRRRVTCCFSPSGLPERIPSPQVLLGGSPARPPGLALDRRGPIVAPAVSDHGPGWVAPLSPVRPE